MKRQLPPLNALRAFEAAGRHLSFRKAAEELGVTPAAISHQVKALEAYCGVPLFRRLTRALLLTDAGQAALPLLGEGLDKLAEAAEGMVRHEDTLLLTISVTPSFAAKWLVPRLDRFRAAYPDYDIRVDATDRIIDFTREPADVAIRYGGGDYPGLRAECLMSEVSSPVCSPRLLEGAHPLRTPEDLRHHTLLHVDWQREDEAAPSWRMWLLAAGVRDVNPTRGQHFNQESMAVQMAIEGYGVALGGNVLAAEDIASGRLVRPFDLSLADPLDFSYYVVCPEESVNRPKVAAFCAWVIAEAQRQTN
jgi:LysR family transcriptional regulator, glycine cleavage system transcriptional activator